MSRDVVDLVLAFESEFGIYVPAADACKITTPRQVTDYVWGKITHERMTREQVAAWVREVIVEQTAVERFGDDWHFVRDMGLYC